MVTFRSLRGAGASCHGRCGNATSLCVELELAQERVMADEPNPPAYDNPVGKGRPSRPADAQRPADRAGALCRVELPFSCGLRGGLTASGVGHPFRSGCRADRAADAR
jgi:hypothetical protein